MASTGIIQGTIKYDLYNVYLSIQFELRKHLRRRRLLIITALAVIVPLLFYVHIPDTASEFAAISLSFLSILIAASGAMLASDAVCGEFEKKTSLLSFPTPQKRSSIFAGKYIAAIMLSFLVVIVYYAITVIQLSHLYGVNELPGELGTSFYVSLIYTTSVVSVVFLFSSILKRSMSATVLGFVSLLLILPVLSRALMRADVEPWFLVTYSANLISSVFGEGGVGFIGPGRSESVFEPTLGIGILIMFAYTIICLVSGMIIANRRGLE
jgi:ABC-2 type transport system permease protein